MRPFPRGSSMSAAAKPDLMPSPRPASAGARPEAAGRRPVVIVLAAICAASLALYARWVVRPYLAVDDFQILLRSWTWQRTWADLWVPANEHAMPLGRLTTWALVWLAGRASAVPQLAALQGPFAVLAGALLLYWFVRRELGHPSYALTAAALFGVSTVYEQAVYWFSASFSVLTLDTLLLALLAAQGWRRTGRPAYLALCAVGTALAPTWFASGILAGPICALYLLPPEGGAPAGRPRLARLIRSALVALVPLAGTGLFLAVSLPRTARTIMHLPHYEGQTALQSFHVLPGLKYTAWSVVENLLLGQLGISSVNVPFGLAVAVWPLVVCAGWWWWRGAPAGRRQMLLGLGLIFLSYLLVYSARADWTYEGRMNRPLWSRYHLLPQLGLALFVAGGLPRWAGRWEARAGSALALLGLVAALAVTQYPRTVWTSWPGEAPEPSGSQNVLSAAWTSWAEGRAADEREYRAQQQALRQIDAVDALCHRYRIGAATARAALATTGEHDIPGCQGREDRWSFLRGSPDPDPSLTAEDARRLLTPPPD